MNKVQRLLGDVRRALQDYQMIRPGDRVCVGLSGGKDSLVLLYALEKLRSFYPVPFTLCAVRVDLGLPHEGDASLRSFCENKGVLLRTVDTSIAEIVFTARNEKHPCSLCSVLRKGALTDAAQELGCTVIAYAHHMDDFVETMMLNLGFEGRFYCFPPVTEFEDRNMRVIRPLMYVRERDTEALSRLLELPVLKNPCPMDGNSRRQEVKLLLNNLQSRDPALPERLFTAIRRAGLPDWPPEMPLKGRKTPVNGPKDVK